MDEFFKLGDRLVVDDGSSDPRLLEYLETMESNGDVVLRQSRNRSGHWSAGLEMAMDRAVTFALEREYDYVNFVQDDTQFVWHDPLFMAKVVEVFERFPDALQVSYHFFKKIMATWVHGQLEYFSAENCYHFRPYALSDLGIVPLSRMRTHGLRVERSEEERNVLLRSQGFKRYSLHSPVLAWVPWPATHRGEASFGRILPPPKRYYIKPLSACQIAELTVRPLAKLPCHEDYCLPWGWRCLSPYWYSTPNWRDYLRLLGRSARDGSLLLPHFVTAGG
jgi:hypothetical protein